MSARHNDWRKQHKDLGLVCEEEHAIDNMVRMCWTQLQAQATHQPYDLGLWTLVVPPGRQRKEENSNNSFSSLIAWVLWGINEKSLCNRKVLLQVEETINIYSLNAQDFL